MFRLGGQETFSGVFRSQELRIGVTAQASGRLAPVLLLRAGALPTDDAWDVRADFPLLSAIETNESIDQDWFFVAEPRNQTPYALWLHSTPAALALFCLALRLPLVSCSHLPEQLRRRCVRYRGR
jgi:hypothetical protein